ncbi:MAG: Ppx/GppA family phosphatase [Actinomycetota bacterium]|nr:MAG: Ppx/GppA family phosphatase [Actinomycetota bacterium]
MISSVSRPDRGSSFSKITEIVNPNQQESAVTIAALDLGSNSFHLVVARAVSEMSFDVLLKEKMMIRLGDAVSKLGYIDEFHIKLVIDSIRSFRTLAESLGAGELVALATSAFRDAENSSEVVDLIEDETGVSVSVISGSKEAELIFKAISTSVSFHDEVVMCADLGGGSLELMIGTQSELLWAHSFNLGVGRLTAKFLQRQDELSAKDIQKMRRFIHETLLPYQDVASSFSPAALVGSSGSLLNLGRIAVSYLRPNIDPKLLEDLNQVSVKRSALKLTGRKIIKSNAQERLAIPGLDPKRVDIIQAAVLVLDELMQMFGFKAITLSEWALREGIILSELEGYESLSEGIDSIRHASVMGVTKRFAWNSFHAEQVAKLALALFDQTVSLHGMSETERELLFYGALLHDIGEHIAMEDHDRHSAYLIENSLLRGFTPQEKWVLVCLGRFHRRGNPKPDFAPFDRLDADWQSMVVKLAGILRLADALDRSHEAVVNSIRVAIEKDHITIYLDADGDFELESFGLRRKRSLFEQTFGTRVTLGLD